MFTGSPAIPMVLLVAAPGDVSADELKERLPAPPSCLCRGRGHGLLQQSPSMTLHGHLLRGVRVGQSYFGMQELGNGRSGSLLRLGLKQNDPKAVAENNGSSCSTRMTRSRRSFGGRHGRSVFLRLRLEGRTAVSVPGHGPARRPALEFAGYFYVPEDKTWKHLATAFSDHRRQGLRGCHSLSKTSNATRFRNNALRPTSVTAGPQRENGPRGEARSADASAPTSMPEWTTADDSGDGALRTQALASMPGATAAASRQPTRRIFLLARPRIDPPAEWSIQDAEQKYQRRSGFTLVGARRYRDHGRSRRADLAGGQKVRAKAANRIKYLNNMKQLAWAFHSYSSTFQDRLPIILQRQVRGSLYFWLLPYIEQDAIYRQGLTSFWTWNAVAGSVVKTYRCPSDTSTWDAPAGGPTAAIRRQCRPLQYPQPFDSVCCGTGSIINMTIARIRWHEYHGLREIWRPITIRTATCGSLWAIPATTRTAPAIESRASTGRWRQGWTYQTYVTNNTTFVQDRPSVSHQPMVVGPGDARSAMHRPHGWQRARRRPASRRRGDASWIQTIDQVVGDYQAGGMVVIQQTRMCWSGLLLLGLVSVCGCGSPFATVEGMVTIDGKREQRHDDFLIRR